ncbi:uncharacterized protein Aud_009401 [Aspergillus udagawae]|uniref:LysM domain-containing protein n=1 Tax=Aspergillus udagawae TaxID=91492 RepID=A0A8E0V2V4_9EURO|nr:uncharacterized protein Aud_009401 [Aspergillus udagawae]GIC92923.1 hypothetical protein Aud_009401 [Aspergillus udagawae]
MHLISSSWLLSLIAFALFSSHALSDIVIFEPGLIANSSDAAADGSLAPGCISAMEATIACDPYLRLQVMADDFSYMASTVRNSICTTSCSQSLSSYHAAVQKACAGSPQPWADTPAILYGDQIWAQYNVSCFKDSKGNYCQDVLANLTLPAGDPSMASLPKSVVCSECVLLLGRLIQSTPFSNYSPRMAKEWAAIQATCGVSYPTAVQPVTGNRTDLPGYAPLGYATAQCLTGKTYTVVSGDDCGKIASQQGVPRGSLTSINNILPDCSNLQVGQKLCIPNTCQLYTIKSGDTCMQITNASSITLSQLRAWNPFINAGCSNLIAGDQICVSQPGAVWTGTTIPGATATKTGVYATATVAPPGPVAFGTTPKCGKYYQVNEGDYCQLIALNFTITVSLFEAINPQINAGCSNLSPGLYYCVLPTADWNQTTTTTTSSYQTAPAPTPSGTTANCYEWYVVQSGDYCAKIESVYGITMAQLRQWNPDLKNDCSNLQLGDAYCVHGDPGGTTAGNMAVRVRAFPTSP